MKIETRDRVLMLAKTLRYGRCGATYIGPGFTGRCILPRKHSEDRHVRKQDRLERHPRDDEHDKYVCWQDEPSNGALMWYENIHDEVERNAERGEITHKCPPKGNALTPCCRRSPFELPHTDRITLDSSLVTCTKVKQ